MEKVADGSCVVKTEVSVHNDSDSGPKRVSKIIFEFLTNKLVDK